MREEIFMEILRHSVCLDHLLCVFDILNRGLEHVQWRVVRVVDEVFEEVFQLYSYLLALIVLTYLERDVFVTLVDRIECPVFPNIELSLRGVS